jgi:hypothetical protein
MIIVLMRGSAEDKLRHTPATLNDDGLTLVAIGVIAFAIADLTHEALGRRYRRQPPHLALPN